MAAKALLSNVLPNAVCNAGVSIHDLPKSRLFGQELRSISVHASPSSSSLRNASSSSSSSSSSASQIVSSLGGKPGFLKTAGGGESNYLPFLKPTQLETTDATSLEEKLEILRERRGYWHEYAPLIPILNRAGITAPVIEEATGMTGTEQNTTVVAAQVYSSISASGKLTAEQLSFFDTGGADILYELRILSTAQREESAIYVVVNNLDAKGAREVARAVKDYERRKREEGRDSFSTTPGDCLAFSLYRQSKEVRSEKEKEGFLKRALGFASTPSAVSKIQQALGLEEAQQAPEEAKPPVVSARVLAARLTAEEISFRPIRFAGELAGLDPASLAALEVSPNVQGPLNVFSPEPGTQWVFLPQWKAIERAQSLVAVSVTNLSELPQGLFSDTPLLLVDVADKSLDEAFYYLTPAGSQGTGAALKPGRELGENPSEVWGKVLLAVFSPLPEDEEKEWA